jgi:hypothetical protein
VDRIYQAALYFITAGITFLIGLTVYISLELTLFGWINLLFFCACIFSFGVIITEGFFGLGRIGKFADDDGWIWPLGLILFQLVFLFVFFEFWRWLGWL